MGDETAGGAIGTGTPFVGAAKGRMNGTGPLPIAGKPAGGVAAIAGGGLVAGAGGDRSVASGRDDGGAISVCPERRGFAGGLVAAATVAIVEAALAAADFASADR